MENNIAINRLNENMDKREKMIDIVLSQYNHLPDHLFYKKEKAIMAKSFIQLLKLSKTQSNG